MKTNNKTINHHFYQLDVISKEKMFDVIIQSSENITTKQVETKLHSGIELRSRGWKLEPKYLYFRRLITGKEVTNIYTFYTTHIYEYTDLVKGEVITENNEGYRRREFLINQSSWN
jgi:hypothetical protein